MLEGIYLPKFETSANYESKILKSDFSNLQYRINKELKRIRRNQMFIFLSKLLTF